MELYIAKEMNQCEELCKVGVRRALQVLSLCDLRSRLTGCNLAQMGCIALVWKKASVGLLAVRHGEKFWRSKNTPGEIQQLNFDAKVTD